ncbi:MAG: autotransporter outer membrane beta-barrel domain-containing protein, partial [Rhodobacteraceae bacterium]|nr:autotransporter outer membrane beta-barrel domain-containing protein [Paracoccaceae bacterium]
SVPKGGFTDAAGLGNWLASNEVTFSSAAVEQTQKVIAQFMQTRANQLISSQPDLTGFLSGGAGGAFDFDITRGNGKFDFARQPGVKNSVWMRFNGTWSRESTARSRYLFGAIGQHLQISPTFLIGGMAEFDYLSQTDVNAQINGYGWLAGPYAVARLPEQPLFLEGRVLYGQTSNDISPLGTYTDSFDTQRVLAQLKVSGEIGFEGTAVMPSLQLSYTSDDQDAYVDSLGNSIPKQGLDLLQAELGLEVRHRVNLQTDRASLELVGGVSMIGSSTHSSGNAALVLPEYEGNRAKVMMGANYIMPNGGDFVLNSHYDGIGVPGYESYGAEIGFDLAF